MTLAFHVRFDRWVVCTIVAALLTPYVVRFGLDSQLAFACGWALSGIAFAVSTVRVERGHE